MPVPQRAANAAAQTLAYLAESGSAEAATKIRQHISAPALAQFSVNSPPEAYMIHSY